MKGMRSSHASFRKFPPTNAPDEEYFGVRSSTRTVSAARVETRDPHDPTSPRREASLFDFAPKTTVFGAFFFQFGGLVGRMWDKSTKERFDLANCQLGRTRCLSPDRGHLLL